MIAEIGANHRNDLEIGKMILLRLKTAGISWVKFQLWKAEDVWVVPPEGAVEPDLQIVNSLLKLAKSQGMSTVLSIFNPSVLPEVELSSIDRWKIGAARSGDRDLVERLSRMETFISSGYADPWAFARQASAFGLTPLVCVSKYPAQGAEYALGTWKEVLGELEWGISDHSSDHGASLGAVALGASWIERHVDFAADHRPWPTRDSGPHVDTPEGLGELQRLARSVSAAICKTPVLKNPVRRVYPLS